MRSYRLLLLFHLITQFNSILDRRMEPTGVSYCLVQGWILFLESGVFRKLSSWGDYYVYR